MARVCVFGDSLVAGYGVATGESWVDRLRSTGIPKSSPRGTPSELEVVNCGISGMRLANVVNLMDEQIRMYRPDAIVVAIGVNDTPHWAYSGTPSEVFAEQYTELMQMDVVRSVRTALVGPANVDEQFLVQGVYSHGYENAAIEELAGIVADTARQFGAPFVDVFGTMAPDDLSDGVHPTAAGHQKLFNVISPEVQKLLPRGLEPVR